jgi:phage gp29-like protein
MTFTDRVSSLFKRSKTPKTPDAPAARPDPWSEYDRRPQAPKAPPGREIPIVALSGFDTVTAIRSTLTDLDRGQFASPALMLDAMLGDSHIAQKLDDRIGGVFGAPFDMQPPPGMEEDETALMVCEDAMPMWDGIVSDNGHRTVLRDGVMLGVGLGEVVVEPAEKDWRLSLKHWHARNIWWRWDTSHPQGGAYWVNTLTGPEEIQRDGRGGFFSVRRDADGGERISRWILYTPYGYRRGWVNARIKAVSVPWILRTWAHRDWGRASEVLGNPPRKVIIPAEWDAAEQTRALREVASMASEAIVRCPQKQDGTGFDVELLELKGTNIWEAFERLAQRAETVISVALVGQTLTTQVDSKGGNRALGEVHERVEARIRENDAKTFSAAARASICVPWCEFNHGSADLAPVPHWAVEPPEDLEATGKGLKAVGDGLLSLATAGVPVDRAKVCQEAGIPLEEGKEFEEPTLPQPKGAPGEEKPEGEDMGDGMDALARLDVLALARTDLPLGARRGQSYVDDLVAAGARRARKELAGDIAALVAIVREIPPLSDGSPDAKAIRLRLVEHYRGMAPAALARQMQRCMVLAEMNGRLSTLEDL